MGVIPAAANLLKDVVMNLRLGGGGVQDRKQFALKIAKDLFQVRARGYITVCGKICPRTELGWGGSSFPCSALVVELLNARLSPHVKVQLVVCAMTARPRLLQICPDEAIFLRRWHGNLVTFLL